MSKNKKGKFRSNKHIDIFGVKFCLPKGAYKMIKKRHPELKGKKLNEKDLQKVNKIIKEGN